MSSIPRPVTLVQNRANAASTTTSAITTTSGNLLVALIGCFGNHIGATPITDSKGNTWVAAITNTGVTANWGAVYYVANCTGGSGHTFTFTPTASDFIFLSVWEVAGMPTSSVLGSTNTSTANTTTHSSGNITSGTTCEIFFGAGHSGATAENTATITSLYFNTSGRVLSVTAGLEGGAVAYAIVPPSTTLSFDYTTASARNNTVMIVGFKSDASLTGGAAAYAFA